jgi:hypothetical protein
MTTRTDIRSLLRQGPMKPSEVAARLGRNYEATRTQMQRMAKAGDRDIGRCPRREDNEALMNDHPTEMSFEFDAVRFLEEATGDVTTEEDRRSVLRFVGDVNPPGHEPDSAVLIASLVVGSMHRMRTKGCDNAGMAMFALTEELARRILTAYVS